MKGIIIKKALQYAIPVASAIGTLAAAIIDQKKTEKIDELIKKVDKIAK